MISTAILLAAALAADTSPHAAAGASPPAPEPLEAPGFGAVRVHAPPSAPSRVVLLLSGTGGNDPGTAALAASLAAQGALAVEVDTPRYLAARTPGRCVYPAGDLEQLAQRIEKLRGLEAYQRPLLIGYSRGAAVAWTALAQAPAGTFSGVVALAGCLEHPVPLALCAAGGPPPRKLDAGELPALVRPPGPFEIVSGAQDETCPAAAAERVASALGAPFTKVPGAGHGLGRELDDAARAAVARVPSPAAPAPAPPPPAASVQPVSDLPVVEVPSPKPGKRLAVLLSGDGGWVGFDKKFSAVLAGAGVPVAGLDSLRYFWKRRTLEETTRDVARILAHYRAVWNRADAILVGYSRGADIVPLVAAKLPPQERAHLKLVAMLGPSTFAELEVHAVDLFTNVKRKGAIPTEDAVRGSDGKVKMLCLHGSDEQGSLCPKIADLPFVKDVVHEGGHRLGGGDETLAKIVLGAVP